MEESDSKRVNGEASGDMDLSSKIGDGSGHTLPSLLRSFLDGVNFGGEQPHLLGRLKSSTWQHAPHLHQASKNSACDLVNWTRRGTALRHLLVISVGTITLIALTGLLVFLFFLVAATVNAVIVSALMSSAAAGGFLALFFISVVAIYIGALSVAVFVISVTTISTIIAVMVATGWGIFFWVVWVVARKSLDLTRQSVGVTSSTIQAFTSRQARQVHPTD